MSGLTVNEIKKLIRDRFFVALLLFAIIFAGFKIYGWRSGFASEESKEFYENRPSDYTRIDYDELYAENEKLYEMKFSGIPVGLKTYVYSHAIDDLLYVKYYEDDMRKYILELKEKAATEKYISGEKRSAKEKNLEKQLSYYNRKRNLAFIDATDTQAFLDHFHRGDLNIVISFSMLSLVVLAVVTVFQKDYVTGASEMVAVTKRGGKSSQTGKLFCIFGFIAVLCLTEFLLELLIARVFFNVRVFSAAIQSLKSFKYNPFSMSLIGYIFCCCLFRFAVLLFAAGICIFSCMGSRGIIRPLFLGILINIVFPLLYVDRYLNLSQSGYDVVRKVSVLRSFVPHALLVPDYYFTSFDSMDIAGLNMFRFSGCIFVSLTVFAAACIIMVLFRNRSRR